MTDAEYVEYLERALISVIREMPPRHRVEFKPPDPNDGPAGFVVKDALDAVSRKRTERVQRACSFGELFLDGDDVRTAANSRLVGWFDGGRFVRAYHTPISPELDDSLRAAAYALREAPAVEGVCTGPGPEDLEVPIRTADRGGLPYAWSYTGGRVVVRRGIVSVVDGVAVSDFDAAAAAVEAEVRAGLVVDGLTFRRVAEPAVPDDVIAAYEATLTR